MIITITLEPVAKGRPKFTKTGHAYTPQKTRDYEDAVRLIARRCVKSPMTGQISVAIDFYLAIPKSWSEAKKIRAWNDEIYPTGKPDLDNLGKAILDACNGILYDDDKQIVSLTMRKYYGEPKTVIKLEEL